MNPLLMMLLGLSQGYGNSGWGGGGWGGQGGPMFGGYGGYSMPPFMQFLFQRMMQQRMQNQGQPQDQSSPDQTSNIQQNPWMNRMAMMNRMYRGDGWAGNGGWNRWNRQATQPINQERPGPTAYGGVAGGDNAAPTDNAPGPASYAGQDQTSPFNTKKKQDNYAAY